MRSRKTKLLILLGALGVAGAATYFLQDSPQSQPQAATAPVDAPILPPDDEVHGLYAGSSTCIECHEAAYTDWMDSNHGMAEREYQEEMDKKAFAPKQTLKHGKDESETFLDAKGVASILTRGLGNQRKIYPVVRIIGHNPLRQFLVPAPGGRLQTCDVSYDPHKNELFDVYGEEEREPGDWGHWTGQGMNWNAMCAACHNTRLRKNYNPQTNSYHTKMAEMSVGCESCHGPMKDHVQWHKNPPPGVSKDAKDPTIKRQTRDQMLETCAACHARRGEISGDLVPGESFYDHFSLTVTDETDIYHPDGQVRDENYEFASFLSSKMHHAGVRCVDCHEPHSGKRLIQGNMLCMRCHAGGTEPPATVIDPLTHGRHAEGSAGNDCTSCHMPTTTYMQRHPRHDHGFTIPDPLLTQQFNVPNACNKCHTDKTTDWALEATQKWWGPKMDRKTRTRATLIAKARLGDAEAREGLVSLLGSDEIPHWKASATLLLDRWIHEPAVQNAVSAQLQHAHPIVRQSAIRTLEPLLQNGSIRSTIEPLLDDPVRGVRVSAAWALRDSLNLDSAAGKDLQHMLHWNADQPSGQMQLAQFDFAQRNTTSAIQHMETAIRWDPNSPPFHHDLAMIYSTTGQTQLAITKLRDAIKLAPNHAEYHYELGLTLSETGDMASVITSLQEAVRLNPTLARAWYNLGLAKNGQGDIPGALEALQRGELADPRDPGIPYARATILAQQGRKQEAIHALDTALRIAPGHGEALQLKAMLSRP